LRQPVSTKRLSAISALENAEPCSILKLRLERQTDPTGRLQLLSGFSGVCRIPFNGLLMARIEVWMMLVVLVI